MDAQALGSTAFIAMLIVPLTSYLKMTGWTHQAKYLLGMGLSLVATLLGAAVDGNIGSMNEFASYFGVALATSQTVYNLYFKNTGLNGTLEEMGINK